MNEGTLALDLTVPSKWPPLSSVNLFDGLANGAAMQVSARPTGTLHFHVKVEEGDITYETPRLALPDFAFLKVAFAWSRTDGIGCAINGTLVTQPADEPLKLDAKSHPPTGFRSQSAFQVPDACSDTERSFLRFVLDLQARIAVKDRFNLLEASAILRRLLLDARPLLHLVNREHRQQLRFPMVPERQVKEAGEGPVFQFMSLCPDFADPAEIESLTFDAFLGTEVLRDHERAFTVRDVIDVCANLKGGIHFDDPVSQSDQSLIKLDKNYLPFFVDGSLAALPGIAWTVAAGVRPLIDTILRKHNRVGV